MAKGKKHGGRSWASLPVAQGSVDLEDPLVVIVDWDAANKAVKPFDEYESRRKVLIASVKSNKTAGDKIMKSPDVVRYMKNMAAIKHNFQEFAKRQGTLGRQFNNWLDQSGLRATYHQLFQVQQLLRTPKFDGVRAEIKKADVFYDALRAAQKELDGMKFPEGGDA